MHIAFYISNSNEVNGDVKMFGRCKNCGYEDLLNTEGLCEICEAKEKGMQWRCFHCLKFYVKKPVECPHCGCPYFTSIEKCREEDQAIEESAKQASHVPEGIARTIATLETKRIRDIFTQ